MKKYYLAYLQIFTLFFILSTAYGQSPLLESTHGNVVLNYLTQEEQGFTTDDLQELLLENDVYSQSTGINHYYVQQMYQGLDIFNAISNVAIKDGKVFYFQNGFYKNIALKVNTISPSISARQAISYVASHFQLGSVGDVMVLEQTNNKLLFSKGLISSLEIPVELILMPMSNADSFRLAWNMSIKTTKGDHWWSIRVDAVTGEILDVLDWILTCNFDADSFKGSTTNQVKPSSTSSSLFKPATFLGDGSSYNVFPIPVESPNHGGRQLLFEPANDNASPFGWHDTDGIAGAEFTYTRGNNVWAQEDIDGDDGTGYSPEGTTSLNFDFSLNLDQSPLGYQDVSLTNLFYANNIMHDVWYEYGFDEVAGNFQQNNYGNGGLGGDYVLADGQDGLGLNNASFGTPPDGGNPGMTMFLWSATGPIGNPLTINDGTLAGDYQGIEAGFGGGLTPTPITANLALVTDFSFSTNTDIHDACDAISNGATLNGKIVVIRRGQCEFGSKVLDVEALGAVAVIMVNNVVGDPIVMGAGAEGDQVTIPSIMISNLDGDPLITALEGGATISASLVAAPPFQKDGSLDSGVMFHEYGHGISNRLTGGPGQANCLSNSEQMGEGWSDWFALMLTMKATDVGSDGRGIGTYLIGEPITGTGIRPAPYSTSFAFNDFTYGDTNNPGLSEPHGIGFVWATVLWDLTWAYIDKYGFDSDLINGNGGNNKAMQLVIDGLKLQPCNPGFVDGRDALLAADMALTGGQDQCMIWDVFAARGLGINASQGSSNSRSDQVEDFTLPNPDSLDLANCTSSPLSNDEFNDQTHKIYPNPTSGVLNIKVSKDYGEVTMTMVDINGRVVLSEKTSLHSKAQLNLQTLKSGIYILRIVGANVTIHEKIVID